MQQHNFQGIELAIIPGIRILSNTTDIAGRHQPMIEIFLYYFFNLLIWLKEMLSRFQVRIGYDDI